MRATRAVAGAAMVLALVAGTVAAPVMAQTAGDGPEPSVGVVPVGTTSDDPNAGQWFIGEGVPGSPDPIRFTARVTNPSSLAQSVKLYLADLDFGDDGTPVVADDSDDIGTWGTVSPGQVTLAPQQAMEIPFELRVPAGADPGDHVGVFVVESQPQDPGTGQLLKIVKRVATRMYVTLPGDARADVAIEGVEIDPDSTVFARESTLRVLVRNNGRVRLAPRVTVNGVEAKGSAIILSSSVEPYLVTLPVPLWGGPQSYRVDVETRVPSSSDAGRNGPARQLRVSRFYVPFVPLSAVVVAIALVAIVRRWLRRRTSKFTALQADLRRFEKLIAERGAAADPTPAPDPVITIKEAIKQAGRAGDHETEERLREKLAGRQAAVAPPPPDEEISPDPPTEAPAAPTVPDPIAVALGLAPASPTGGVGTGEGHDATDQADDDDGGLDLPMLDDHEPDGYLPLDPSVTLGGSLVNRHD